MALCTRYNHRVILDNDWCEDCQQLICPDAGLVVVYDVNNDVYAHDDDTTCFLHAHTKSEWEVIFAEAGKVVEWDTDAHITA